LASLGSTLHDQPARSSDRSQSLEPTFHSPTATQALRLLLP
jgi:hypothetical protein